MAQKILFDGYCLNRRYEGTGIRRYAVNLLKAIEKLPPAESPQFRILLPSLADWHGNGRHSHPGFEFKAMPLMRFHRSWKYGLVNSLALDSEVDAVFAPTPVSVYLKPKRLAVTVHDVIPLIFPERYRSLTGKAMIHAYSSSLRHADLILTVSEHSKRDMAERLRVASGRIVVAYEGFDTDSFTAGQADTAEVRQLLGRHGIKRSFVLHVGRGDPRKNLVRLVQAYEALIERRKDLDFQLVLAGSPGWGSEPLVELMRKPSLQGKVLLTGPVPDRELPLLYRNATCFCMPSLYEGFGLPVLEAMACGTPVMSSNRSSLPEIAGNAALYFDPESAEAMSAVMEILLTDSAKRAQLVIRGLEQAKHFSWEACAQSTLAALKKL